MCIFRLGVLLDRKKLYNIDTMAKLGLDVDGDILYYKNKVYFVNELHSEFRRLYYPQQYLTLSSKHWVKMIQKDFGQEITGEMNFYTYNAIMTAYGEDTLSLDEYFRSLGVIREKDLRKSMHKYYMKATLYRREGINNSK